MISVTTEVIRHIYNEEDNFLTVRPNPESSGCVTLQSEGSDNEEFFGKLEILLSTEFAHQLGQALINCANEIKCNNNE